MSESFEGVMAFARKISDCEFGEHPNDSVREWCEIHDCGTCTVCLNRLLDRLQKAHEHDMEQCMREQFARGYTDGQRSMDAEHRAVALRLQALPLGEDSHGNLSQIARAIWHNDFGWTQGACESLRDELIRLMGGVHDEPVSVGEPSDADCDGCDCGAGEPWRVTYDELGNERHKAVCELRKLPDWYTHDGKGSRDEKFNEALSDAIGVMGLPSFAKIRDRLIHLLGGDEPTMSLGTRLGQASVDAMSRRAKSCKGGETIKSGGECDGELIESGENHQIEGTITDELRESLREIAEHMGVPHDRDLTDYSDEAVIDAIYWRIDNFYQVNIDELQAQVIECCKQRDKARAEVVNLRDAYYKMQRRLEHDCTELQLKLDTIREMLDE